MFTVRKNRLHTPVCASDSSQQERLPVALEVGRIYFYSLDLSTQRRSLRKKQKNCKCNMVFTFHRDEITYFEMK